MDVMARRMGGSQVDHEDDVMDEELDEDEDYNDLCFIEIELDMEDAKENVLNVAEYIRQQTGVSAVSFRLCGSARGAARVQACCLTLLFT